jgi:Rod binding domain-containing protein
MSASPAIQIYPPVASPVSPRPRNAAEAAREFEALLIGQMLKAARRDDQAGWFGSGEDAGSGIAAELAEGQFAQALARSGGLGLSRRIAASLSREAPADSEAPSLRGVLQSGLRR